MKIFTLYFLLITFLQADVFLDMNIKHFYKDLNLSKQQKNYLLTNQDRIIQTTTIEANNLLDTDTSLQNLKTSATISFLLTQDGNLEDFHFISKSDVSQMNNFAEESIDYAYFKLPPTDVDVPIRIEFRLSPSKQSSSDKMQKMQDKKNSFNTRHPNARRSLRR